MLSVSKFLLDGLQLHLGWLDGAEVFRDLQFICGVMIIPPPPPLTPPPIPRGIIDRDSESGERLLRHPLPESVMDYPKFVEEFYVELRERSRSWCENQVFFKGLPTIAVKDEVHREFVF